MANLLPAYATRKRFKWLAFSPYIVLHLSLVLAIPTFSMEGLLVLLVLYFITMCFGTTLCYHRLLAHRSFQTYKPIKYFLTLIGCLAFQRGPIWWTATHRLHHSKVDTDLDVHSPSVSFVWSQWLWPFFKHPQLDESEDNVRRLALDLYEDKGMRFLEKHYSSINILFLGLLFGIGYLRGGVDLGLSWLVWGGFMRLICSLNATWMVNSVAHLWGYRNYGTPDKSRNNWLVAFLTCGEGWHNNHHADQRAARNGHYWYEFDVTYWVIVLMERLGFAHKVIPVSQHYPLLRGLNPPPVSRLELSRT